jgi:tRNA C32,U32 (ribose-2'-O)-methylase TrmJ
VSIPSHEDYPSLNLAQSVMILAYELRMTLDPELNSVHTYSGSSERDMEELYLQIETVLERTGFFIRNPEKNVMVHLKDILSSGIETSRDVRIFRGIFRRIAWYLNKEDRSKV